MHRVILARYNRRTSETGRLVRNAENILRFTENVVIISKLNEARTDEKSKNAGTRMKEREENDERSGALQGAACAVRR